MTIKPFSMRREFLISLSSAVGWLTTSMPAAVASTSAVATTPIRVLAPTLHPDGETARPSGATAISASPTVVAIPARSPALRLLDADLESLLLRQKTLAQALTLKQAETRDLQGRSTQSWEQTRLPVASAQLADTQRELAQVEADLKAVRQKIAETERIDNVAPLTPVAPTAVTHQLLIGVTPAQRAAEARAVAQKSGLTLRRITLAEVIGPDHATTERNLQTAFAAAQQSDAILFFDEADALFGKRSEVKDSHDRYANQETGYLLQRIEAYSGRVIVGVKATPSDSSALPAWPRTTFPTPSPTPRP